MNLFGFPVVASDNVELPAEEIVLGPQEKLMPDLDKSAADEFVSIAQKWCDRNNWMVCSHCGESYHVSVFIPDECREHLAFK